jgi:hypothetical protein
LTAISMLAGGQSAVPCGPNEELRPARAGEVVVLGHSECGAIKGAIVRGELGDLTQLLAKMRAAVVETSPR